MLDKLNCIADSVFEAAGVDRCTFALNQQGTEWTVTMVYWADNSKRGKGDRKLYKTIAEGCSHVVDDCKPRCEDAFKFAAVMMRIACLTRKLVDALLGHNLEDAIVDTGDRDGGSLAETTDDSAASSSAATPGASAATGTAPTNASSSTTSSTGTDGRTVRCCAAQPAP